MIFDRTLRAGLALALLMIVSTGAMAEERVVNAYSAWSFTGQVIPSSRTGAQLVGAFRGVVFVEEDEGLRDAGNIACTTDMTLDVENGGTAGSGSCVISNSAGHRLFGRYECEGSIGLGCSGTFEITSGTTEFEGTTGKGEFMLRTVALATGAGQLGNVVEGPMNGLAIWRDLRMSIPDTNDASSSKSQ